MPDRHVFSFRRVVIGLARYWWLLVLAGGLVAVAFILKGLKDDPPVRMELVHSTSIDLTPEEISAIRRVGQWEFLSITTEEMVEWHARRTFSNLHLVRIYSGTLRLGVDLTDAQDDWFTSLPDSTARLVLPSVGLLDEHFINEAATRTFYEKGTIPGAVRDSLYNQAREKMKHRCLTADNLQTAENAARERFTMIFQSLGFKKVNISFRQSR